MSQTKAQLLEGKTDQDVNAKTIALAGATSGTATISATAIAGTPTLTLPSLSGTIDRLNRAGNILQVVNATYSTSTSITATSFTDSGLSASITPTSASSKIFVIVDQIAVATQNVTSAYRQYTSQLLRGATQIALKDADMYAAIGSNGYYGMMFSGSYAYLDSPSTTSSTTYKTQGKVDNAASLTTLRFQPFSSTSSITLLEVAA